MTNSERYNKEQFEKAGEQAAQVLGRFMSMASRFTNEFNHNTDGGVDQPGQSESKKQSNDQVDILREAGEQLQNMREAAGYTLDSFAEALKKEMNRPDINDADVVVKVEAAESGQQPYPRDWLNQVSSLLGNSDPFQFFESMQKSYHCNGSSEQSHDVHPDSSHAESLQAARTRRFTALFEGDAELAACTEEQFEKLLGFVENSYKEAKNLLISS